MITEEINNRLTSGLRGIFGNDEGKISYMAVISNGYVNMANLCVAASYAVNGIGRKKGNYSLMHGLIFHAMPHPASYACRGFPTKLRLFSLMLLVRLTYLLVPQLNF